MKKESHTLRFGILAFAGFVLFSAAISNVATAPPSMACTSNPNCMGWSVERKGCEWFCNCGQQQMPYTCYTEVGTCNADGTAVVFRRCYQGNCCCPSGNCAGQGGGGGGGGGNLQNFNNGYGEECFDDSECGAGLYCDWSSNTCQY